MSFNSYSTDEKTSTNEDFLTKDFTLPLSETTLMIDLDIIEDELYYKVNFLTPLKKEDLCINLSNNILNILQISDDFPDKECLLHSIVIPQGIDKEAITASYIDDSLSVILPKHKRKINSERFIYIH